MKKIATLFAVVLAASLPAMPTLHAQQATISNAGTDFWMSMPPAPEIPGSASALYLYISAPAKATVEVTAPGFKRSVTVLPQSTAQVVVSQPIAQPYSREIASNFSVERHNEDVIFAGRGLHIASDVPVVVQAVMRVPYASEGFTVLPAHALGKEYVVDAYFDGLKVRNSSLSGPSEMTVTAAHDSTVVTVRIGGNGSTTTGGGRSPGSAFSKTLNRGDVLALEASGALATLTGTYITASKPVAVVSGNLCADIPVGTPECNYLAEMEAPTHTWGRAYHVAPVVCRTKPPLLHVMAKSPNTTVLVDGETLGVLEQGPGGNQDEGWFETRAHASAEQKGVTYRADKPFYIHRFNPSTNDDVTSCTIDPFQITLTPVEHYQNEVLFSVPGSTGTAAFPNNYANVIYTPNANGTIPDDLEIGMPQADTVAWTRVKDMFGANPGITFAGTVDGRSYAAKTLSLPATPRPYRMRAKQPIGVYLYGHSESDSYGMSATPAVSNIAVADVVPPEIPPLPVAIDGSVSAEAADQPELAALRSNMAVVQLVGSGSYNYSLQIGSFVAGADRRVEWSLDVIDLWQPARATVRFADQAGNDTTIVVDYAPKPLVLQATGGTFGEVQVGASASGFVEVQNTTDYTMLVVNSAVHGVNETSFGASVPQPLTLAANTKVLVPVTFTPTRAGELYTDLVLLGYLGDVVLIPLSGTGAAPTSVADPATESAVLYPNPARDAATLRWMPSPGSPTEITVYNAAGRTVLRHSHPATHEAATHTLHLSALPQGAYTVVLVSGTSSHRLPLTVAR